VVFDGVGGALAQDAMCMARHGARFTSFGGASGRMTTAEAVEERGLRLIRGSTIVTSPADNRLLVESALAAAVAGQLRVLTGQSFELTRAAAAHAAIEARATVGKTVLYC
jgi:NADPH2:quinone reductase